MAVAQAADTSTVRGRRSNLLLSENSHLTVRDEATRCHGDHDRNAKLVAESSWSLSQRPLTNVCRRDAGMIPTTPKDSA
jgi:hypothetical protein